MTGATVFQRWGGFLIVIACGLVPSRTCPAGLLNPSDFPFRGLDQQQWGQAYITWAVVSGLGNNSLPDTLNGARFLPPNYGGGNFQANVTIGGGTALVGSPFFVFGENYDDGTSDLDIPNLPDLLDLIFDTTMIRTTLDGVELLSGSASSFPTRDINYFLFPVPIPYATPQPRGGVNAVAAVFGLGVLTVYDGLSPGEHTIVNTVDSAFFGQSSYTYNLSVVPEPTSGLLFGGAALALALYSRRRSRTAAR